ncbi:hypothetical protein CR492_17990 [Methylocella silvestris]|uniref:Uncharacterized protein n=1 Tax=Methylocella silvestris TaxID=199596 RepID=A0A2J7TCP8_METSI|nr:hypothetical protein CR492_17990 [Methylocella silvestris]
MGGASPIAAAERNHEREALIEHDVASEPLRGFMGLQRQKGPNLTGERERRLRAHFSGAATLAPRR